jgi:glucose/arabinose dehydrogenase
MKKYLLVTIVFALFLAVGYLANFYWHNLRGAGPALLPANDNIVELDEADSKSDTADGLPAAVNDTDFPLNLPERFNISIFAAELPGARVIAGPDPRGNYWVSQTGQGIVSLLEVQNGKVANQTAVIKNLNKPHGLALDPQNPFILYIAETDKISRVRTYSDGLMEKIIDLPEGGRHFSRTIAFGPDERLYVSIGSSCDTCLEDNELRAAIHSMNRDGSDVRKFATGLRNAVFFTWSEIDGRMWATEMGRDFLGDDLPPDEVNIVEEGNNYGWPICYGQQIHDTVFDKNQYVRNPCEDTEPAQIDLPAHSAPLGLAFVPESTTWPEESWHDLIIAFHGSWNRTEPTGYKLVKVKLDEQGNFLGLEDFISGWLTADNRSSGRPVDVKIFHDGTLLVTDDKAGVVYKINYAGN